MAEEKKGTGDNGPTEATLKSWKEKYGSLIHVLEAPLNKDETEVITVVVKSPENDRNICASIENKIDSNLGQSRLIAVQNCVLHNKEAVLDNNVAFRAISTYIFDLIPNGKVRVKN